MKKKKKKKKTQIIFGDENDLFRSQTVSEFYIGKTDFETIKRLQHMKHAL